jgi:hypothetical protein
MNQASEKSLVQILKLIAEGVVAWAALGLCIGLLTTKELSTVPKVVLVLLVFAFLVYIIAQTEKKVRQLL